MEFKHVVLVYGILWIVECSVISTLTFPAPVEYRKVACTLEGALDYMIGQSLWRCHERCDRMHRCKSINYNLYSKLCVLQETKTVGSRYQSHCVSIEINSKISRLEGPCSSRPCDNSSICVSTQNNLTLGYSCLLLFCPSPPPVDHAVLMTDVPTPVGRRIAYRCVHGYTGVSSPSIRCLQNGTWTSTDFTCYPNCPVVPVKANAGIISWSPVRLFTNTTAKYRCKSGFYSLTDASIVCDDGAWSEFACLPYCYHSDLPVLTHGSAVRGDTYTINMQAQYTCGEGYYLSPGSPFLNCSETGVWLTLEVTCFKHCSFPSATANAVYMAIPLAPYVDGSTVLFSCNSGFYSHPFEQTLSAVCRLDGGWDYFAECYRHCGDPPSGVWHVDGYTLDYISTPSPYTVSSYAKYNCIATNHLSGDNNDKKTCDRYGNWNGAVYCCVATFDYNPAENKCTWLGQK